MVELASKAGLFLDPWQEFALECALWEMPSWDDDGLWEWAAFEVGLLVPRQNGKGTILEAREIAGLFLFEEDLILHSAHEFKTSGEAFRRVKMVVENNSWMLRKVASFSTAHGNEGIELKPTPVIIGPTGVMTGGRVCRLRFVARTGGSARGFTANLVVWDEAFNLPETVVGAQLPTLSAVRNPQLWYTSSAVDKDVHAYGLTLARVRVRALAEAKAAAEGVRGGDGASYDEYDELADDGYGGLAWLEWSADEAAYAEAQRVSARQVREFIAQVPQWQAANPGVGFRLRARKIARELRAMGAKTFAVERLGLGDWPDVDADAGRVDMARWAELADPHTRPVGRRIALALEVSPDGRTAALASGSRRDDGSWHVKVTDHRPGGGTGWVVPRIVDLCARYEVCAILLNPASPAGALLADLAEAGVAEWNVKRPGKGGYRAVTMREYAQACGAFVADIRDVGDAVTPDPLRLRHAGQLVLTDALREAGTRNLADAWAWDHKTSGSDITTLVAATLAIHGFRVHGTEKGMVPWAEYV